jgi:DNA mismatch repair ATPase MutS
MPFAVAAAATALFFSRWRRRVGAVVAGVERPLRDLALLSQVLERFERESFSSPRLVRLRTMLDTEGDPPSRAISSLARLVVLLDSRRNQIFAIPAFLLLWTFHLAAAIEKWRATHGPAVPRWLEAVGEMEALCSLAAYAYEHPGDPFPEMAAGGARFDGEGLGHPLLPADRVVRNDVRLGSDLGVLIVSGSNMSGKSTLLRTVGVNAVLALAGAPVRARKLTLSPLAVGASIRIHDSLQAGTSRFYAEITRLRQIADLARSSGALLFLLDEILHGTNSHDRRIGGESIVKKFVEKGGIGLVTTHDLALAQIAGSMNGRAANVHFEDHIEGGRISFDYRLRQGVVTKSNALELMRSVGLEI